MLDAKEIMLKLSQYGVGRRKFDDELFSGDSAPARRGVYDEDEDLAQESAAGAGVAGAGAAGSYRCAACGRALPSPHLLDLHVQETHDSFFDLLSKRQPSYCCYIQECTEKFMNAEERLDHCVKVHKLPKDFRFDMKPKGANKHKKKNKPQDPASMEVDPAGNGSEKTQKFYFHNNKKKGLVNYTGKKFTSDKPDKSSTDTNHLDEIMSDLKENLPE